MRLRDLFAKRDDPYAGVDLANAGRIGGAIWLLGAAFTAILLPLAPPDDAPIGAAGWVFAALLVLGAVAGGWRLRSRGSSLSVDELLLHSYAAIVALAVMAWLSGGIDSPYSQLLVLSAIYTAAVHPPRRAMPFLGVLVALALAPLAYGDWSGPSALSLGTEVFIWIALASVGMYLMSVVRAQRLGLRREGEQARRQARIDPLTGLLNRRAFDEALERGLERAHAAQTSLSVLVADLDDFKAINDRFGHLEGDRVLCAVAESLQRALRRPDVAYRWGGDEFALILPDADAGAAERVAGRIRMTVAENATPDGRPVGLATGVAQCEPGQSAEALVAAADRALLLAKDSGSVEVPGTRG